MRRNFLFEADDDNAEFSEAKETDAGTEDSGGEETTDNNSEESDTTQQDDTGEEESSPEEPAEEEPGDDDFTIKDPEETPAEDKGGEEPVEDTSSTDETPAEGGEESSEETDSPAKETERNLFDSLSPEEQEIKNKMLKKLFIELYSNCDAIINKFNDIGSDLEDVSVQIKKVLSILFNLKQMIDDYLMNIYKTKSYIENDIVFNRYLSILNSVKNIIKEIDKYYDDTTK